MTGNVIIPNSFQHPNVFIDRLAYYLTSEEEKVLNKAVREILGWQNRIEDRKACISLSVFVDGKISSETGEHLCHGCGLSVHTVRRALEGLEQYRVLLPIGTPTQQGQEYWLQDDPNAIDWGGLEARRNEWDKANQARIKAATAKSLEKRGVTSDVRDNVGRQAEGNVGRQAGVTSDVKKETHKKPSRNNAAKPRQQASPAGGLTEGQRFFLHSLNAKRFKNNVQKESILSLEKQYGTARLKEAITWAAKRGMTLGGAVLALEGALPDWGKPKGEATKDGVLKVGR